VNWERRAIPFAFELAWSPNLVNPGVASLELFFMPIHPLMRIRIAQNWHHMQLSAWSSLVPVLLRPCATTVTAITAAAAAAIAATTITTKVYTHRLQALEHSVHVGVIHTHHTVIIE
jgi:hypothetical protein